MGIRERSYEHTTAAIYDVEYTPPRHSDHETTAMHGMTNPLHDLIIFVITHSCRN